MLITEKDVGRAVKLRDGRVIFIIRFSDDSVFPVVGNDYTWRIDGTYHTEPHYTSPNDIVEFVDNEESIVEKLEAYITDCFDDVDYQQQMILVDLAQKVLNKEIVKVVHYKLVDLKD